MLPTPADVHVNVPLTQISIAMMQDQANFVSARVFPNIPVQKQSDRYYTYDRGHFNRDQMRKRAPGTETDGVEFTIDNTPNYFCDVWGVHHPVDDQRRANSDSVLAPDMEATDLVTLQGLIRREKNWVTKFFAGSIWTSDWDGVAAGENGTSTFRQWNDAASTPIEDLRLAKTTMLERTGFEPNVLVIGQRVFDKLIDHPDIIDRVKYGQTSGPAMVDTAELVALLKIPNIFVMKAIENTANEGATNVHAFIGGKKALLAYAPPNPGLRTPSAGYTFSWAGYLGAAGPEGNVISSFRMPNLRADWIEIEMAFDQKLIAADLGVFFDTIVA